MGSTSRGMAPGPWEYQGIVPHRIEEANYPTACLTVQAGLNLSPLFGGGLYRDHQGIDQCYWQGPAEKPMGDVQSDGTIKWVDTTGLNQSSQQIPPQVPMMGPAMNRQSWGGMPDHGVPRPGLLGGFGIRPRKKR